MVSPGETGEVFAEIPSTVVFRLLPVSASLMVIGDGEKQAAEVLGIPFDKYSQGGLFPIAYTAVISFMDWDLVRNAGDLFGEALHQPVVQHVA